MNVIRHHRQNSGTECRPPFFTVFAKTHFIVQLLLKGFLNTVIQQYFVGVGQFGHVSRCLTRFLTDYRALCRRLNLLSRCQAIVIRW